jgi:hypothetical protein
MALVALATHASAERGLTVYSNGEPVDYEDCNNWDVHLLPNTKYIGKFSDLKSAGVKKTATASKCGDLCAVTEDCFNFNFYKKRR